MRIINQYKKSAMENFITWFEIPAADFLRGVHFYESILNIKIHTADMFGNMMGFLPSDDKHVSGAIVCGDDYKPSADGTVLYLNGGNDLSVIFDKVEKAGGSILVPKTQINPETGFFAMFLDTEGNKMAIHSKH